jgi:hypothetical protein
MESSFMFDHVAGICAASGKRLEASAVNLFTPSNHAVFARSRRNTRFGSVVVLGAALLTAGSLNAQYKAKVQIDPSKPRAMFYPTSIGTAADVWDGKPFTPETIQLLNDAGITNLRYPGNGGIDALYHFSTGKVTNPYSNDKAPDFGPDKGFPKALPALVQIGTALITVNYGSNLDGSGGGEPAEAAAEVAYANGSATSTQVIGKDSKGNDWKTVGYWASLRGADPLPTDDGYNALRIGHSAPFGIQLWAVGNEPFKNGFYNGNGGEADLRAGQIPSKKEWLRHSGDKRLGPTAYGQGVVEFVKAMKAVDPSILVGATLVAPDPGEDHLGKNWDVEVLKAACASMDFATVSVMSGKAVDTDWKTLDDADLLKNALGRDFGALMQDIGPNEQKNCPAGHFPQLAITNFGVNSWMPTKHPVAIGLYAAEGVASMMERGVYTVEWTPEHSVFMIDDSNKPKPAYYGIKMIHEMGQPGDVFVTTTNSLDALGVHAVKRTDGGLGLLFVGKEIGQSYKVTVSINGYNYATKGTRYDWNQGSLDAGKDVTSAPIDNLGPTFTVDVPASGIVAIVIPKA